MSALLRTALHEHQISFPGSAAGIGISDVHHSNTTIMLTTYAIADQWLIYFLRIEKEQGCILPGLIPENRANNEAFLKAKKEPVLIFLHIKNEPTLRIVLKCET